MPLDNIKIYVDSVFLIKCKKGLKGGLSTNPTHKVGFFLFIYTLWSDGQINSTTYSVGKFEESTIILNRQNGQIIEVSQVIMENDSLVVCRKLTRSI